MVYPTKPHQRTLLPHIKTFETSIEFSKIYDRIINEPTGRANISITAGGVKKQFEYRWKKVNICLQVFIIWQPFSSFSH